MVCYGIFWSGQFTLPTNEKNQLITKNTTTLNTFLSSCVTRCSITRPSDSISSSIVTTSQPPCTTDGNRSDLILSPKYKTYRGINEHKGKQNKICWTGKYQSSIYWALGQRWKFFPGLRPSPFFFHLASNAFPDTVKPVLSGHCIKRTPSIKQTVAEVPKFISLIYFKWNLY